MMAGNHSSTTNFNKHLLTDALGLSQYSNTTIFRKKGFFVLSPAVQNKYLWFDLRKINLDRQNKQTEKGYLLIRLSGEFVLCDLDHFYEKLVADFEAVNTTHSGKHWKFLVYRKDGKNVSIVNQNDKSNEFKAEIVSLDYLKGFFAKSHI
jgi:superoxide dismutase